MGKYCNYSNVICALPYFLSFSPTITNLKKARNLNDGMHKQSILEYAGAKSGIKMITSLTSWEDHTSEAMLITQA